MLDLPKRDRRSRNGRVGRTCHVCHHPDRTRIEANRLAGVLLKDLRDEFGVSIAAIHRHMQKHVSAELKAELMADLPLKEIAERARKEGVSLLDYFGIVRGTVFRQLVAAGAINDRPAVAALAGKAVDVLESIGKLTGELRQLSAPSQNIINNTAVFVSSPIFTELQSMLVSRLAPYPAALAAVVAGLRELEDRSAPEGLAGGLGSPRKAIEHQDLAA